MAETTERTERSLRGGLVLTVLSVLCALSVLSCEDSGARPTTTMPATDSADQVLQGFSHFVTKDGVRRSQVQADTAYFYENTQVAQLRKIRVIFYDLDGQETSTLTAKTGSYRWQDGSMEANGTVLVVAPDGRKLATESLKYDNASNTISTNAHFTFDRGAEHLEGNSFKSDPDFRNVVTDRPHGTAGNGLLLPGQEPAEAEPGKPGPAKPGAARPGPAKRGPPKPGPAKPGLAEPAPTKPGTPR